MSNTIELKNGVIAQVAEYVDKSVMGLNNPLIDCLPVLPKRKELIKALACYPEYSEIDRTLDRNTRVLMTTNINSCFQTLPITIQVLEKLEFILKNGYMHRNPLGKESAEQFHGLYSHLNGGTRRLNTNEGAEGCIIVGSSGTGKTSTTIRCIREFYPEVIVHSEYRGIAFSLHHITFLHCNMSKDGSIKGLFYEILSKLDNILGTEHVLKSKNDSADVLLIKTKAILLNHVGCLIIDEIQHLSLQKSGGKERILNILLNLCDAGIPVVMIGTPQSIQLIMSSGFRQARRSVASGGSIVFDRIKDKKEWSLLMKSIWKYQYCENPVPLDDGMKDLFYDLTIGTPSLLKALYIAVQQSCIRSGKETFNTELILDVYNKQFQLVIPAVKAFRSGLLKEMIKYEDLYIPKERIEDLATFEKRDLTQKKVQTKRKLKEKTITKKEEPDGGKPSISRNMADIEGDLRVYIKENKDDNHSEHFLLKEMGIVLNISLDPIFRGMCI